MLKASQIIDARALVMAIEQQSTLPTELQSAFYKIGTTLAADPNYIDRAIQRCIELVATYPPLQSAYQITSNDLQAVTNDRSKGVPPKPIDPTLEFSQEIANTVRDVCLAAGKEPQQPVSLWDRLLGKKSKVS
jgi:hypothetical protein